MAVGLKSLPRVKIMKRQIQARASATYKNSHVIEHTPIYDLDAYLQRQKKLKLTQIKKNAFQALTFFCAVLLVSPILFLGN